MKWGLLVNSRFNKILAFTIQAISVSCILFFSSLSFCDTEDRDHEVMHDNPNTNLGTYRYAGLPASYLFDAPECVKFVDSNGNYGDYGKIIQTALLETPRFRKALLENDRVANDAQVKLICPNFSNLTEPERVKFYVYTIAAIARDESRCKLNPDSYDDICPTCVGMMQLPDALSERSFRGPACNVSNIRAPVNTLKCSLDILRGQFEELYGKPWGKNPSWLALSYWEKLRTPGVSGPVKERMKLIPGCKIVDGGK